MSRDNVEAVRQAIEATRSGDPEGLEAVLELIDPSCEFTSMMAAVEPHTYRGHEGIRRYASDLDDRWTELRTDVEEIFEVSPNTVFATIRSRAIGKESGAAVEARLGVVWVLSDGKLLRGHVYRSPEEALEAVRR